jgi:ketosteroid isomerase-like protein
MLDAHEVTLRSFALMEHWDEDEARRLVHPEFVNHEAAVEPPAARVAGIAALKGTYDWLHSTHSDLSFEVLDVVADGDRGMARVVMRGRQTGPFVVHDASGAVDRVFAPTGRSFEQTQMHLYRFRDGLVAEHWANRDDLGMAGQLGWIPPSPVFLLRGALLKRRLRAA